LVVTILAFQLAIGQAPSTLQISSLDSNAAQIAHLLNLDSELQRLVALRALRSPDSPPTMDELSIRQQILETVQVCSLQVDSVIAEIANEQSEISSVRTVLQDRRDRKVSHLTTAALLVGSGLGVGASATQFTTLSNTTQNLGNGVAIGSGAATIVLSILASRAQNGPRGAVESAPNMLAPLLGGTSVLHTSYPPVVLEYLQSVPAGEDPSRGTRLQQLMKQWNDTGRLNLGNKVDRDQKIRVLTTSSNPAVRVSIADVTDRVAMLGDVRGRVSLIKRDLAQLMLFAQGRAE
jgi:hypothetical protein